MDRFARQAHKYVLYYRYYVKGTDWDREFKSIEAMIRWIKSEGVYFKKNWHFSRVVKVY